MNIVLPEIPSCHRLSTNGISSRPSAFCIFAFLCIFRNGKLSDLRESLSNETQWEKTSPYSLERTLEVTLFFKSLLNRNGANYRSLSPTFKPQWGLLENCCPTGTAQRMVYIIIGKHLWPLREQVFISWGCWNKWPKLRWPQTRERHSFPILQTRSLKLRSQQGHYLSDDSRRGFFLASSGGCL